jgi:hypothetical protein
VADDEEQRITVGEVYRLFKRIDDNMLTKDEYHAREEGIDRRFSVVEKAVGDVQANAAAMDAKLETKIDGVRDAAASEVEHLAKRMDKREESDRNRTFQIWLGIGLGAVAIAGGVFTNLLSAGIIAH